MAGDGCCPSCFHRRVHLHSPLASGPPSAVFSSSEAPLWWAGPLSCPGYRCRDLWGCGRVPSGVALEVPRCPVSRLVLLPQTRGPSGLGQGQGSTHISRQLRTSTWVFVRATQLWARWPCPPQPRLRHPPPLPFLPILTDISAVASSRSLHLQVPSAPASRRPYSLSSGSKTERGRAGPGEGRTPTASTACPLPRGPGATCRRT